MRHYSDVHGSPERAFVGRRNRSVALASLLRLQWLHLRGTPYLAMTQSPQALVTARLNLTQRIERFLENADRGTAETYSRRSRSRRWHLRWERSV